MILVRYKFTKNSVMGVLKDDVGGTYYTLENAKTLIPTGKYRVEVNLSPHFKKLLPLLYNEQVPACRGVRIHNGNYYYQSEACVLVGNTASLKSESLGLSTQALNQLLKNCGKFLEIKNIE